MPPISSKQRIKFEAMLCAELTPKRLTMRYYRRNYLICLRKTVVHVQMAESLRYPTPSVHFFFWEFIDVV